MKLEADKIYLLKGGNIMRFVAEKNSAVAFFRGLRSNHPFGHPVNTTDVIRQLSIGDVLVLERRRAEAEVRGLLQEAEDMKAAIKELAQ